MSLNVLLTCAGRRNYMVDYFRAALDEGKNVHVANNAQNLSTMAVCDAQVLLPSIYEQSYVDRLLTYCLSNDIGLVVPLFDLELSILAVHREMFEKNGVVVAVSSEDVCTTCLDKVATNQFLAKVGLNTIPFYVEIEPALDALERGEVSFPLFVKPRIGMGSIGLYEVRTPLQLRGCFEMVGQAIDATYLSNTTEDIGKDKVLIQPSLDGDEYGLDVLNDLEGTYVTTVVKMKSGMRSGETDGAITMELPELELIGQKIGTTLHHRGNLDVDVFWNGVEAHVLELNPRFGGGYPFSHMAGANFPAAYVAWSQGTDVDPGWLTVETGVTSVKGISLHTVK